MMKVIGVHIISSKKKGEINFEQEVFISNLQCIAEDKFLLEEAVSESEYDSEIIYVESGGSEALFLENIPKYKQPFVLLAHPENNSLASAMEILAYCRNHGYRGEIICGTAEYVCTQLEEILKISQAKKKLAKSRLGVIGGLSDWLIASKVDYKKCQNKFGLELVDISLTEVVAGYQHSNHSLESNSNIKKAIEAVLEKYELDGYTIRCFDLDQKCKTTGCYAVSHHNPEYTAVCEGDVPSLISMEIIKQLFHESSFMANVVAINPENNTLVFAHCAAPADMVESFAYNTDFESSIGLVVKGKLKETNATIFRISNDLEKHIAIPAKILCNLNEDSLYRTQILVQVKEEDLEYFLTKPFGNRHIICYGEKGKLINRFFSFG